MYHLSDLKMYVLRVELSKEKLGTLWTVEYIYSLINLCQIYGKYDNDVGLP